ncbi:hypothetical protein LBMAG42_41260 [Deltaproteobacteria bacterium]|nr:hypothetical protein LBMAG42_41260 [Deltaproteobacteria bacterium]
MASLAVYTGSANSIRSGYPEARMLLSLSALLAGAAHARDYTCGGGEDFADLNLAFAALAGAAGPNTLDIVRDDCIPAAVEEVVSVDVDVICNIGGGCELPPLRVTGGDHFGLSGVTFVSTAEFAMDESDDNRDLFPGYDSVYASLYIDSTELVVHDSVFESPSASFGGIVAIDCDTTLDNVSVTYPSGHALKLYADDLDIELSLTSVHILGAGDSAILVLDGGDGYGRGAVTSLSVSGSDFTGNSAYYGSDMEVFVTGGVSVTNTQFVDSVAYALAAPVELFAGSVWLEEVSFSGNYGGGMSTFFVGANTVTAREVSASGVAPAPYVAYVTALTSSEISDSRFAMDGQFYVTGGPAEFRGNTFLMAADAAADSGIRLDTSSADFTQNFFCGSGAIANEYGLVSGPTELYFEENIFNGLSLLGPLVDTRSDDDVTVSATGASFFDNTIVNVSASNLVAGDVAAFVFVNNLVVDSAATFDSASWRGGITADYNAWTFTDGSSYAAPDGWGAHDLLGEAPLFVESYDAGSCPSLPALQPESPMIDRGSPSRYSGDGSRSDIGAVDFGDEEDWGGEPWDDTGASGDEDDTAGGADRDGDGWNDNEDCAPTKPAIHPKAVDVPDDGIDQDCDGVEASTSYTGGCGCDADAHRPSVVALLGLTLVALRKRRR